MENWKSIEGYDFYEVSDNGNVRNAKTGRILKATVDGCGYYKVRLCINSKATTKRIHRLVADAFIDNPENKTCVDHIDNIRKNNHVSNLRFATNKENSQNRKISKRNTSGIKGISYYKGSKKWQAYINIDGIRIYLGYFDNIEDAKQARIQRANQAFGIYTNACEKI